MAKIGDCFRVGDSGIVHRIADIRNGFTPADTECDDYYATCGETGQSWSGMGVPVTQIWKEIPENEHLCSTCFPPKREEEQD